MKIDLAVLGRQFSLHQEEYEEAALRALRSGWYILGPELKAFEHEFAEFVGAKYCVGVNSGLDALTLALRAALFPLAVSASFAGHFSTRFSNPVSTSS